MHSKARGSIWSMAVVTALLGCGPGGLNPTDASPATDGGPGGTAPPAIVSLSASAPLVTEGEVFRVTAVVADPDGAGDLAGGILSGEDGNVYGAFEAAGAGLYETSLGWSELDAAGPLAFGPGATVERALTARFWDLAGAETTGTVSVAAYCENGWPACFGHCADPDGLVTPWEETRGFDFPYSDGFESYAPTTSLPPPWFSYRGVGALPTQEVLVESAAQTGIPAAAGDRYLVMYKDAGPYPDGNFWLPLVSLHPVSYGQPLRVEFSVRVEAGHDFLFMARDLTTDPGQTCCRDLLIRLDAATGDVVTNATVTPVMPGPFPYGEWVRITMEQHYDAVRGMLHDVTVEAPGLPAATLADLPNPFAPGCGLYEMTWVSTVVPAAASAAWELDDVLVTTAD